MKMKYLLIILPLMGFFYACHSETKEKKEEGKFLVTNPIEKDTLFNKEYVAQVHSISHIEMRSQERGYLQNIYVDEGQLVKKGQLMFQIMPALYQTELEKAQAEMNYVQIEYENTKKLAENNVVSQNELALAKAKLDKAKAEVSLAKVHLDLTQIRAPFDGIMGRFETRLGSLIEEGELLTTLSDNSKMWVYFNVPEAEYLDYANGADQSKKVSLEMANKQIYDHIGIIETIEADFNNETGNIAFRATFPNPKGILRHGETGNILIPVNLHHALIIPQKATFEILDKKYVFVIDENNVVHSKQISVGQELPHLYIVTGGISATDKILLEGLRKVKNDEKISYEFEDPLHVMASLDELHAE